MKEGSESPHEQESKLARAHDGRVHAQSLVMWQQDGLALVLPAQCDVNRKANESVAKWQRGVVDSLLVE